MDNNKAPNEQQNPTDIPSSPAPLNSNPISNTEISAEEAKLERTLKKSDVESYIIEALNSDAKTLVALLVDKVTLYEDTIEISFKYSNNTNPDETLTEVHRDFLLFGKKMKITQRSFTAIFELNKWYFTYKK